MQRAKSIVTKYSEICAFCGSPAQAMHHLVFGTSERKISDNDGLVLPVCNRCHNMNNQGKQNTLVIHGNSAAEIMSKMIGQLAWEKHKIALTPGMTEDEAREAFQKRYGRSYL